MSAMMPIDSYIRNEWLRLASDAKSKKRLGVAERYRKHATGPDHIPLALYDRLQCFYRGWLIQGFPKDD
jgi:hypothetical protein